MRFHVGRDLQAHASLLSQVDSALSQSGARRGALGPRTQLRAAPRPAGRVSEGLKALLVGVGASSVRSNRVGLASPGPRSPLPPGVRPRPPCPGPRRPHALSAHADHGAGGTRRPSADGDSRAGGDTPGSGPRQRQALHQLPSEPAGDEGKAHPLRPRHKTLLLPPARGRGCLESPGQMTPRD